MGRDSPVGITTRYGLGGPGDRIPVEGKIFRTRTDRPWVPPSLLYNGCRVFPGGLSGRGAVLTPPPPPPSSAKVEGRVELYVCSHFGPSWPVLGRTLPLPLPNYHTGPFESSPLSHFQCQFKYCSHLPPCHALYFNPLNTKRRPLYLKTQFVPRSKHFSSRL